MSTKKEVIIIDTVTAMQDNDYMAENKKVNFDKWRDYGKDLWMFITKIQDLGFTTILVLGEPGTGKSTGIRTLNPEKTVWFNADNKNPMWKQGFKDYGSKSNPIEKRHFIPKSYKEITNILEKAIKINIFEEQRYAIILGHVEDYRSGFEMKQRISVLGNLANKMRLEGKLEIVLYSKVKFDTENNKRRYLLETQNNGVNTARSPMDLFDEEIDNDYDFIIKKLKEYYD